jgi:tripartite-type tricarboxylate transporter receptor subunit TctC
MLRVQQLQASILLASVGVVMNLTVYDVFAQTYPTKPIRLVVGFSAGSAADFTGRLLAQKLAEQLGQSIIVENRVGAGGTIATERVVSAAADGYTLLLITAPETAQPALRKLPYDMERDLAPISLVTIGAFVLVVHPSVPARNVKELIALARAQPGKLSYGTSGVGSSAHLAGALFNALAGVNIVHVPYKGSPEVVVANVSGQVDLSFPSNVAVLPLIPIGKLRPLALPSAKRSTLMPSIPTLSESGVPGYDRYSWYGISASGRAAEYSCTA